MDIVEIEVTTSLPTDGVAGLAYTIEGIAKLAGKISAPPWIYAEVKRKEWYRPEVLEETTYERGFPMPASGEFKIDWRPEKRGIYDVTIVATPALIPLPVIGVPPITGKSDLMKITIAEKPEIEAGLEILACSFA